MPASLHGPTATNVSERLDALESKLAFAEDAQNELHQALLAQQRRMDDLEIRLRMLIETVKGLEAEPPRQGADDERPPHY